MIVFIGILFAHATNFFDCILILLIWPIIHKVLFKPLNKTTKNIHTSEKNIRISKFPEKIWYHLKSEAKFHRRVHRDNQLCMSRWATRQLDTMVSPLPTNSLSFACGWVRATVNRLCTRYVLWFYCWWLGPFQYVCIVMLCTLWILEHMF